MTTTRRLGESAQPFHSTWSMQLALATRKPSDSEFRVGDLVRVKAGELMPDRSPTIWRGAIDGAEGVVSEISRDPDTAELQFHVTLNHQTLERMPQDYASEACTPTRLSCSAGNWSTLTGHQQKHQVGEFNSGAVMRPCR